MTAPAHSSTPRPIWFSCALIIAITAVAYFNSLRGPFVFDDASSIVTNPTIRQLWPLPGPLAPPQTNVTAQGRPILNLSLAVNYAFGGTAVEGYHVVNAIIHALAALTLFGIVRRTLHLPPVSGTLPAATHATSIAFATAVLWAIHPLQTESVTYVIQRAESLVGLFYLLTLYAFIRGTESSSRALVWLTCAIVACALGMATKEVMATAPLMVLFYDRTFMAGSFMSAVRSRARFYAALSATWLLLGWLVIQTGGNRGGSVGFGVNVGAWDYWLTQFKAVGHYLRLSFWPHPLVFEYGSFWIDDFGEIALQVVIVLGLLAGTIWAIWRRRPTGFLGAWFFGILAPTSLAPGTTQMIVEHRMYLPLAAIVVACVCGVQRILDVSPRIVRAGMFGSITIGLLLLTVRRNADYRSDVRLWADTVAKRPANPLAHFMLAGAYERAGTLEAAQKSYRQTLELKPDFSIGHEQLGELLLRQGQRAEAIAHFESALRLQPQYPDAHANIGNAYLAEGRITEAVGHLEKAVQLMPDSATAHYNLGNALATSGLAADAVSEFEAALKLQPGMAEAHYNLANALVETQRTRDALPHYEAALKARPDYAAAHYNFGNALAGLGQREAAVAQYEAALQVKPDYAEARHNLASALFELGRLSDAAREYEATLQVAPDFPNARANLDRVRAALQKR